jgi:transposase
MAESDIKFEGKTREQVKAMAAEGKSAKEIAEALGKTPATIYSHLRNLNATPRKRGRPRKTEEAAEKVVASVKSPPKAATNGHTKVDGSLKQHIESEIAKREHEIEVLRETLTVIG